MLMMTAFSGVNLSVVTPVLARLVLFVSCLSTARPCGGTQAITAPASGGRPTGCRTSYPRFRSEDPQGANAA